MLQTGDSVARCARILFDRPLQKPALGRLVDASTRIVDPGACMALSECVGCREPVSTSASQCPHCGLTPPLGVVCLFCAARMTSEAAIELPTGRGWVHQACIDRFFTPPEALQCSDCAARVANAGLRGWSLIRSHHNSCPTCGRRNPVPWRNVCRSCSLPIFQFQVYSNAYASDIDVHPFCASAASTGMFGLDPPR